MNEAQERRFLTNSSNVPSGADTLNPEAAMKDIAVPAKKIMFCVIIVIYGWRYRKDGSYVWLTPG
jgi:hypothetical protein